MREPLAAPLAVVASGVFAARFASLPFEYVVVAGALCAGLAIVGLWAERLWAGKTACLFGMALLGAGLPGSVAQKSDGRIDAAVEGLDLEIPVRLSGWVREPPEHFEEADRIVLETEAAFNGTPVWGGVRVTVNRLEDEPPLDLRYGERIELLARLRRLHGYQNPGSFDRVRYLNRQRIYMTATVRPYAPLLPQGGRNGSRFQSWLWAARSASSRRFDELARRTGIQDTQAAAILRSSLLGDRGALDQETETAFQRSGTYHVLVVSGLHVGVLAGSVFWLLTWTGAPRSLAGAASILTATAYALLLQSPLPAVRAAWMLAAFVTAALFYRRRKSINALAAVALGFLAVDPESLFEPSFQLSFGAVAAIAGIGVPLLDEWIAPRLKASRDLRNLDLDLHLGAALSERRTAMRRRLEPLAAATPIPLGVWAAGERWVWLGVSTVLVSTVLLVALAAPTAAHFQRLATASPGTNLWAMPLIAVLVPTGFVAMAANSATLFSGAGWLAARLEETARLGAEANLDVRTPQPPEWLAAIALASLALWWWGLGERASWRWYAAVPALAIFGLIAWHPFEARTETGHMELTAIDVGQGESLLLVGPEGSAVLVDAGGLPDYGGSAGAFDVGEAVVSPYLWSRSIQRLRALAVTHPDADHMGGAAAILRNFAVDELWLGEDGLEDEHDELVLEAQSQGTAIRRLRAGDSVPLGEARIEVLSPEKPLLEKVNDRSLAMLARYGERSFLLTGDLEAAGEDRAARRMAPASGGLLKAGHHGSSTSSGLNLLRRFRPAIAIASAGYGNVHGHPSPRVIDRLRQERVILLRTDQEGAVTVRTDGRRLTVRTYRRDQLSSSSSRR